MKYKRITICLMGLLSYPILTLSQIEPVYSPLPVSHGIVNIVPDKRLLLDQSPKGLNKQKKMMALIREKGYVERFSESAKYLLTMSAPTSSTLTTNEEQLKTSLKSIKLAFPFRMIDILKTSKVIGFAAGGTKVKNGWSEINIYFKDKMLGRCLFTLSNFKLSHGSAFYGKESVQYIINNKASGIDVDGNRLSGYHYMLTWTDDTYHHILECATKEYNKNILPRMINTAQIIDSQLNAVSRPPGT